MSRALALARLGEGCTRPNPAVGAVVVRNGRVLGEGFHRRAGLPHAEVEAINASRGSVHGATLYVTLEPCCTHGRTPPCTDLLIRSGIKRVVVGCADPNPRHASRGFRILREAGIEVTRGVREDECRQLIEPFAKRMTTGLPFVTLKLAMTLDGRIADRTGTSKWITGPQARKIVQTLRRRADAVLVGAGTVAADDPSLRCRMRGAGTAWRVVVDGNGRVPADAQVLTDRWADATIIATTAACAASRRAAWACQGSQVWSLPGRDGRLNLRNLLKKMAKNNIMHVLCEGGGALAGGLLKAGLVDELVLFYAPAIMGDARATSGFVGADFRLASMPRFCIKEVAHIGSDIMVRARCE